MEVHLSIGQHSQNGEKSTTGRSRNEERKARKLYVFRVLGEEIKKQNKGNTGYGRSTLIQAKDVKH
jgi:hypothetical protein